MRRLRTIGKIRDQVAQDEREYGKGAYTSASVQLIADFCVPYLKVPDGIDPAEAVWDLSVTQLESIMTAAGGNQTVPKESAEDSPEPTGEN